MGDQMGLRGAMIVAGLALLHNGGGAQAHVWYPKVCCNDQDCFRVTEIEHAPDGALRLRAGHITVIVPRGFVIQPSLDADAHVCVYRNMLGHYVPRCVFMPGLM